MLQTTNKVGALTKDMALDTWFTTEFDLVNILNTVEQPTPSEIYLRKLSLVTKAPATDLYDPKNVDDVATAYKIRIKSIGFKNGTALVPEVLKVAGKTPLEVLKTIATKLNLTGIIKSASERRYDQLSLELSDSVLSNFEVKEGVNLLDVSNEKYTPAAI